MEDDWDLQAVVRGCSTATTTTTTTSTNTTSTTNTTNNNTCFMPSDFHSSPSFSSFCSSSPPQQAAVVDQLLLFSPPPDPIKSRNAIEELHDLYKPFFPKSQPPQPHPLSSVQITPTISSFSSLSTPSKDQAQPKQQHQHQQSKQSSHAGSLTTTTPRSKKRKNQLKKVCQVPAESLSSDIWAWRKYGQKPIKGSPYPRGYYRCSSSKGCLARKQVERNRSDPEMFIVTYTAEHNHPAPTHRNSLAGSTRQKPFSPQPAATAGDPTKPTTAKPCSPATSTSVDEEQLLVAPQGTTTEIKEDKASPMVEDEEEEFFGLCDTVVSDDFFVGLEGLAGDYFSDHSPARFGIPWIAKNAAAAAGSI